VRAIRKIDALGWKPLHFLPSADASIATVLQPAGLKRSVGILTSEYWKDPTEARWKSDPAVLDYAAWMKRYFKNGDVAEIQNVYGYSAAQLMVHVLRRCGDDLTRANVMRQAESLKGLSLPMLLPGITINTSASDFLPIKDMFLARFDGTEWPVVE
jgi:branched-chain amino acid transport system substrate-binding protein